MIASNPFLAAAAKAIPIAAGGTTVGIEGVALQMMSNAIKQHYQAGREFSRSFRSELKAALKESKEDWYRRMRLKIILTADIIRSKKTHWPSVALLAQDPRQIIWTDEDDVVRIKTVALAERIRKLTRMEPTLRNEVEALVGQVRAAKTAEDRDRCHRKIQERVMLVNELLSYGIRERPNAEKIVRVLAEQYLADGRDPVSGWKFEDWSD